MPVSGCAASPAVCTIQPLSPLPTITDPVIIDGYWSEPRIYPEMSGILENPDQAYAKLREMGKGLFGKDGAGLGAAIGGLLSGIQQGGAQPGQQGGAGPPFGRVGAAQVDAVHRGVHGDPPSLSP